MSRSVSKTKKTGYPRPGVWDVVYPSGWRTVRGWRLTAHFGIDERWPGYWVLTHTPSGLTPLEWSNTDVLIDMAMMLDVLASNRKALACRYPKQVIRAWSKKLREAINQERAVVFDYSDKPYAPQSARDIPPRRARDAA